jgi:phosphoadenosine phosphosulfate reductase
LLPEDEPLLVTTSLSDAVLATVMSLMDVPHRLVLVDTGYHFPETMDFLHRMNQILPVPIQLVSASESRQEHEAKLGAQPYLTKPDVCCTRRKVEPLKPVLAASSSWVTGVRRADGGARVNAPPILADLHHDLLKINPLLLWTDADVEQFVREHDLPEHPLKSRGFLSIGCEPCTNAPETSGSRSGRWAGLNKTECGLHREFLAPEGPRPTALPTVHLAKLGGEMHEDSRIQELLLAGCDERIALRADTQANQYHLHPMRYEGLLMRGSCTCGTLTADGHETARRFVRDYTETDDQLWVDQQTQRLQKLFASNAGQPFDVYFGPSGSDMMYWPLLMQSVLNPGQTIVNIVSCPEELGSGSILAAEGKYFAEFNQFGNRVPKGEVVSGELSIDVRFLPARESSGRIADRRQQIREIVETHPDQPIVGNLVFGSKSGIKDDLAIIDEFRENVMWVVDMCQFRTGTDLVRELLGKGVSVMVTGSKFYQAPPFCGALLVPASWTQQLARKPALHLASYGSIFAAHDAPVELAQLREMWPNHINAGLRLRWEIALDEMEAYLAFPWNSTEDLITRWNRVVVGRLALSDQFSLMPDMELTNDSIVSFAVTVDGHELNHDELKRLFDSLVLENHDEVEGFDRVFIGQPVKYGDRSFIRFAIGSQAVREMLSADSFNAENDLRLIDLVEATALELFGR